MRAYGAALLLSCGLAFGAGPGTFESLGTYRGLGALVASAVGPGPAAGSERFYLSYLYIENTIDVVAVDPNTGEFRVFPNPAPTESGARTMVAGPDGKMYLGTLPGAHLLCLDPKKGTLVDLGRPSQTEQYIWDVTVGPDKKIYGATYPQSKLVRYDPASGRLEDLGRMDPKELYAHYVAGSDDGFMYVGIGTSHANVAAYQIATGDHREILPASAQVVGQAVVSRGRDGKVYARVGSQNFRMDGWNATPIPASAVSPAPPTNLMRDGRAVTVQGNVIRVSDPRTQAVSEHRFEYRGNKLPVFRVAFGPDGRLYGSSVLPIHFLRVDHDSIRDLGDLGGGEIYSFLAHKNKLLAAAYSGVAPLMVFDPSKPFDQAGDVKNPALVHFSGEDSGWRPQAMINGPDGLVYVGAVSGYGKLGGPLAIWDVDAGTVRSLDQLIKDESVITLTAAGTQVVGGTTVGGGGGSFPTQKEARLFVWDTKSGRKVFETVPVSGASRLNDLVTAPNGLVYGVAGGRKLFTFDPVSRAVKPAAELPFNASVYNSVAVGPDGALWGLTSDGVFRLDPKTNHTAIVARAPARITAGFAIDKRGLYFASGPEVWRFNWPSSAPGS